MTRRYRATKLRTTLQRPIGTPVEEGGKQYSRIHWRLFFARHRFGSVAFDVLADGIDGRAAEHPYDDHSAFAKEAEDLIAKWLRLNDVRQLDVCPNCQHTNRVDRECSWCGMHPHTRDYVRQGGERAKLKPVDHGHDDRVDAMTFVFRKSVTPEEFIAVLEGRMTSTVDGLKPAPVEMSECPKCHFRFRTDVRDVGSYCAYCRDGSQHCFSDRVRAGAAFAELGRIVGEHAGHHCLDGYSQYEAYTFPNGAKVVDAYRVTPDGKRETVLTETAPAKVRPAITPDARDWLKNFEGW